MSRDEHEQAVMSCATCRRETVHSISYAGRIIVNSRCTYCGKVTPFVGHSLPLDYLHDLRLRVQSKPERIAHRAFRHPLRVARSLPRDIARQPGKLMHEVKVAFSRNH